MPASAEWLTPSGVRFTGVDDELSVDVLANVKQAAELGVDRVEFTINGVVTTVSTRALRRPTFNTTQSPRTGTMQMMEVSCYGLTVNAADHAAGTITITARAITGLGTITDLPDPVRIYNDKDGTDRRPSSKTIYIDADDGNDANDGSTRALAKLKIQEGTIDAATGGDLSGAKLVLMASTNNHQWAGGKWGVPSLLCSNDLPFTIEIEPGATIERVGTVSTQNGGIQYNQPDHTLTIGGGDIRVWLKLMDPVNRQVIGGDLKVSFNPANKAVFITEGGSSGSAHFDPVAAPYSVRFVEDRNDTFDPKPSGGTNYELYYYNHTRLGVVDGFVGHTQTIDCAISNFLAIGSKMTGGYRGSNINLKVASVRYGPDVDGLVDCAVDDKVTITAEAGGIMRVHQNAGTTIRAVEGGSETTEIDIAVHGAVIIDNALWGHRFNTGYAAGNTGRFQVKGAGMLNGRPYVDYANPSAVNETPAVGARITTHLLVSGLNTGYRQEIHPDIAQVISDLTDSQQIGVRPEDLRNSRGWAFSTLGTTITRLIMHNCSDGGLVNDFDTANFVDCVFDHCTFWATWTWTASSITGNEISNCVIAAYNNLPLGGSNTVVDCHFIGSIPVGIDPESGPWFAGDPLADPWSLEPLPGNLGKASPSGVAPAGLYWDGASAPTHGVWRDVGLDDVSGGTTQPQQPQQPGEPGGPSEKLRMYLRTVPRPSVRPVRA